MCTSITYTPNDHYFGRNLDLEISYNEQVTSTPRNFPFVYRKASKQKSHDAIIDIAAVVDNPPSIMMQQMKKV